MNMAPTPVSGIYTVSVSELYKTAITPVIQRDHVSRVNGGEVEHFNNRELFPQHQFYAVAIYGGDEDLELTYGDRLLIIKTGDVFMVDGNTRREFNLQRSVVNPEIAKFIETGVVAVAVRKFYKEGELEEFYGSFDSKMQLKTNKHVKQSAMSLAGLDDVSDTMHYEITTALNKVTNNDKKKKDFSNSERYGAYQIEQFGIDNIRNFHNIVLRYEKITGKKLPKKFSIGSCMIAHRALVVSNPSKTKEIDDLFVRMWTHDIESEIVTATKQNKNSAIGVLCGLYFDHKECDRIFNKGSSTELMAKNNGDKINIQSGMIYSLVSKYLDNKDVFVRVPSAETALKEFTNKIKLK